MVTSAKIASPRISLFFIYLLLWNQRVTNKGPLLVQGKAIVGHLAQGRAASHSEDQALIKDVKTQG